jgi:hypothetical protein
MPGKCSTTGLHPSLSPASMHFLKFDLPVNMAVSDTWVPVSSYRTAKCDSSILVF